MNKVESKSELLRRYIEKSIEVHRYIGGMDTKSGWDTYDSSVQSYQISFRKVLEGKDILSWAQSKDTLTVVDLMSSSEAIASIFTSLPSDKPKFGLAVSLEDVRSDLQKERDGRLNIEKLDGDIILPSTWRKIEKKLAGRRADLIVERAQGGILTLPRDSGFYEFTMGRMWKMLNEGGMLLLETPYLCNFSMPADISQWARLLMINNINAIFDDYAMKLVKTPDSPEKLPFLQ